MQDSPPRPNQSAKPHQSTNTQVVPDPQKKLVVPVLPAPAPLLAEVDPRSRAGSVVHHDAVQRRVGPVGVVVVPDGGLEPLAAGVADGWVWEEVFVVV